jgi:hypothetical protein
MVMMPKVLNKVKFENTVTGATHTRVIEQGTAVLITDKFPHWKVIKTEFYGYK